MSSTSHLTVVQATETKIDKVRRSFNLGKTPREHSSDLLQPVSPSTNLNQLYYIHADPTRKQSIAIVHNLKATSSIKESSSLSVRRKLSAISLPIPWNKRTRSPSDDKTSTESIAKHSLQQQQQQQHRKSHHKMSRDRLLTLDRLFSSGSHTTATTNDEEQASPITESTALEDSTKSNEKTIKPMKENGYLHSSPRLLTR